MLVKYANFGRLCAVLLLLQTFVPQAADAKKSGGKIAFLGGALAGVVGGGLLGHIMTKQMQQQPQPIAQQQQPVNPPPQPVPQPVNQPPFQPMQTQFSYPSIQQQPQPAIQQQAQAWQPSYSYPVDQSSAQHVQPVQPQFPQPAAPQLPASVQQQSQPLGPAVEQHPYGWDPRLAQPSAQPAQSAGQYPPQFPQPVTSHISAPAPAPAPAPAQPATYPPLQPSNSHVEHHAPQPGQTQFIYPPLAHLPESAQPQPSQAAAQKPTQPEHSQPAHPAIENVSDSAHPQLQPTQQPAERSLFRTLIEKLRPHNTDEENQPPKDTQNPHKSGIQDSFLNIKTSVDQPHAPSEQQQQYPPQQPAQYAAGQTAPASAVKVELPAPIASQQQPVLTDVSSHVQVPAQPGVAPAWHAPAAQPAAAIGGTPIQPGQLAFPTPTPTLPPAQPTEGSSGLSKKRSLFGKSSADKTQQTNFVLMMMMFFLLLWFRE